MRMRKVGNEKEHVANICIEHFPPNVFPWQFFFFFFFFQTRAELKELTGWKKKGKRNDQEKRVEEASV